MTTVPSNQMVTKIRSKGIHSLTTFQPIDHKSIFHDREMAFQSIAHLLILIQGKIFMDKPILEQDRNFKKKVRNLAFVEKTLLAPKLMVMIFKHHLHMIF